MENIVLNRQHRPSTALRLQVRARRVERLAEAALSIAERYEQAGRWPSALALIEAVLRDPDLPADDLAVGQRVEVIPNHICPAVNLYDELAAHRGGVFEGFLPIPGRGKSR